MCPRAQAARRGQLGGGVSAGDSKRHWRCVYVFVFVFLCVRAQKLACACETLNSVRIEAGCARARA